MRIISHGHWYTGIYYFSPGADLGAIASPIFVVEPLLSGSSCVCVSSKLQTPEELQQLHRGL